MKKKITKTIIILFLGILIAIMCIIAYFIMVDIETKVPEKVESTCNLEVKEFMGRNLFVVTKKEQENPEKTILYCHGGSYVAEISGDHWDFIEKLVNDTGYRVILPDYPLTPKYTYEDVFAMMEPLYKEIIDHIEAKDLIVMGDSAGGGLCLALEEELSKQNVEMPSKTILISPWLDVRLTNPKIDEVQKQDKELNKETLRLAGIAYAGGEENTGNYLVSPIEGDVSKLKNITIFTGTNDILNPDIYVLEEKAKQVGLFLTIKEYQGAGHIWMINQNSDEELVKKGYQDLVASVKEP